MLQDIITRIVFGDNQNKKNQVRRVMVRQVGNTDLELWHALDVTDFSSFRSFVASEQSDSIYDVDFLSRHEIIYPMSVESLPHGWQNWSSAYKGQLIINDKTEFRRMMLTPDALVALPTYRFEFFADDVRTWVDESGYDIKISIENVLNSLLTGYSYKKYNKSSSDGEPYSIFCLGNALRCCLDKK